MQIAVVEAVLVKGGVCLQPTASGDSVPVVNAWKLPPNVEGERRTWGDARVEDRAVPISKLWRVGKEPRCFKAYVPRIRDGLATFTLESLQVPVTTRYDMRRTGNIWRVFRVEVSEPM